MGFKSSLGWRDGSMVKSANCSSRGPEIKSQEPHGGSQPSIMRSDALKLFLNFVLFFQDRVSLYSPGCPGTHSVDYAGLELRNLPASAFQVLGLKACTTTAWQEIRIVKDKGGTDSGQQWTMDIFLQKRQDVCMERNQDHFLFSVS